MAQQHIAAIRDVPLVGHGHDGNTWLGHDVKLGQGISQGDCGQRAFCIASFSYALRHLFEQLVVPITLVPKSYRSQFVSRRASGQDASDESAFWPMVYQRW